MSANSGKQPTKRTAASKQKASAKGRATAKQPTRRTGAARPQAAKKRPSASAGQAKPKAKPKAGSQASSRAARPSVGKARSHVAPARKVGLGERIVSSRPAMIALVIVCALVVVGLFDTAANWGKAYGNVSVNGIDVGGMTEGEMLDALKGEFGARVSHAQVTVYADEAARQRGEEQDAAIDSLLDGEGDAEAEIAEEELGELDEAEDGASPSGTWKVDALSLKATVPYEDAIARALAVGRGDGGIAKRLALLAGGEEIELAVEFDDGLLESLASDIDSVIGDPRVDATVEVVGGVAQAIEGRAGTLVDRSWLADRISRAMIRGDVPDEFVAEATEAQSRITGEQAREMAEGINRAIAEGVVFSYEGRTWLAGPAVLGDWTHVSIVGEEGSWRLAAAIDQSQVVPVVVEKVGAEMTSDDVTVTFEDSAEGVLVRTAGTGDVPEVSAAAAELDATLYGDDGLAWGAGAAEAPVIEVTESSRPESLAFDDAVSLGVVTVVGECTTEFTDYAGTENRNHNIKLAADTLDGCIIEAGGGTWSFNDIAGDTDEAAGYWTAGSIIDGEIVDSVGGGICQVATTIFNSVLEAGLEVLERHNHTMYMSNYPTGRDAAIDYPTGVDLRWANGLESDVLLKMSYTDTSVTARLYSVYTGYSADYDVGDWEEGEKYETVFEEDDALGEGNYYLKTVGEDGTKITVTRRVSDAKGSLLFTDAFTSLYEPQDEVYIVGPGVDTSKLGSKRGDDAEGGQAA